MTELAPGTRVGIRNPNVSLAYSAPGFVKGTLVLRGEAGPAGAGGTDSDVAGYVGDTTPSATLTAIRDQFVPVRTADYDVPDGILVGNRASAAGGSANLLFELAMNRLDPSTDVMQHYSGYSFYYGTQTGTGSLQGASDQAVGYISTGGALVGTVLGYEGIGEGNGDDPAAELPGGIVGLQGTALVAGTPDIPTAMSINASGPRESGAYTGVLGEARSLNVQEPTVGVIRRAIRSVGTARFIKGAAAMVFELANDTDVRQWGSNGATFTGYASDGTSARVVLDPQDGASIRANAIWFNGSTSGFVAEDAGTTGTGSHFEAKTNGVTIFKVNKDGLAGSAIDSDTALTANSDTKVPSQKAVKAYADTKQPSDADLTAIAALSTTAYGRAFLELANQAALTALLPLDIDGTLAANSDAKIATQKAVKTYADQLIASADAMVFKGVIDASANPNYPAADKGHTYRISVAGKIGGASGTVVEVGDLILCLTDGTAAGTQAAVGANWSVAQTNIDGAVVGPSTVADGEAVLFDGPSGRLVKRATGTGPVKWTAGVPSVGAINLSGSEVTGTIAEARLPDRLLASALGTAINDANSATSSGVYWCDTNIPAGPTGVLVRVAAFTTGFVVQFAHDPRGAGAWIRETAADVSAGAWGSWRRVVDKTYGDTLYQPLSTLTESVQDIIGALFADSASLDVTYDDAGNALSAVVLNKAQAISFQNLVFHAGTTGVYTLTPLTAGTVEPANVPMGRILVDLANATQMRIVAGQRIMGSGGTSCELRMQYASDGATQSTWVDANNTGSGLDLRTGTANTVHTTGWVDLKTAAKANDTYMRCAIVTVGTVSTAPTLQFVEVHFR